MYWHWASGVSCFVVGFFGDMLGAGLLIHPAWLKTPVDKGWFDDQI